MTAYIIRRLLGIPFLVLGVTLVTFLLMHLTPGSPVSGLRLTNPNMTAEQVESIKMTLGLDKPLHLQYLSWLQQLAQGDLGISMRDFRPVSQSIAERLPNTLLLTGSAFIVSTLIAIPLGVLSAIKRNSLLDYITTIGSAAGIAMPSVWLGLLLIILFSVQFKAWGLPSFPTAGMQTIPGGGGLWDRIIHLVLPVSTLALIEAAGSLKFARYLMLEVLDEDYIRTARAKGLAERSVITGHAFRNAMLPWITSLGLRIPILFGGAVIVESIFSWPGMGSFAVDAAVNRDFTAVMGIVLFFSLLTILGNLLADIVSAVVDPRITLH